jgi:hypothetical protein
LKNSLFLKRKFHEDLLILIYYYIS